MSNVVRFPEAGDREPRQRDETPRGPQVEDGFTRIANDLFEALIAAPLTDRERRVAMAVIRLTYGWNKKADRIADSQLADVAHLPRQRVNQLKQSLIAKQVLKVQGAGHGLLSINKHFDQWKLEAKHVPIGGDKKGDNVTHGSDKDCHPRGCTPKTQDSNSSPYGEESTAGADDAHRGDQDPVEPKGETKAKREADRLPNCPHQAILDQWAEIMPEKRQPLRSLWAKGTGGSRDLAARWKQGFGILNEHTGEPLYTDEASGIDWWGRFFKFLRRSEFLMRDDSRFFGLDWVSKADNFRKIMELKYHADLAPGDGGES